MGAGHYHMKGDQLHPMAKLLARRVISVEAFRHELYKLRNGYMCKDDLKRPNEQMVRIPIILWPGETMPQYTQKFEQWLASRDLSLVSLRDNPAKERSLWLSFAHTRAGTYTNSPWWNIAIATPCETAFTFTISFKISLKIIVAKHSSKLSERTICNG
ncbi:hypothetical protein PHMEG_00010871 [Phytophthora megakarya]|uniref:Uncharacterized protein n=1 Tax=Phytophthora megakarya TaxID=4795 RepID=A0A225WCX3_9STRA|nr:hypothetical protein PHMEG_00010871 [Phytophthora megakarya]